MITLERIPDQVGYLALTEDGAVIASGGELENAEQMANIIVSLVTLTDSIVGDDGGYKKISVTYPDHSYIICLSNKRTYVVKKRFSVPVATNGLDAVSITPALVVPSASINA